MPCLLILDKIKNNYIPSRFLRASDIEALSSEANSDWKTIIYDEKSNKLSILKGSIGV